MFILAGIIADPAPIPSHDERSSREQLRDSSQWQQRKGPSYIFITTSRDPQKKHKQQNIIAQCIILATRSVCFRVQFHLKCEGRCQEWLQQGLRCLAAPAMPGCRWSQRSGPSWRAFSHWDTNWFAPPLLRELTGSYLSLEYYPSVPMEPECVTAFVTDKTWACRQTLTIIPYIPFSQVQTRADSSVKQTFLELQILVSLGADTPSPWNKRGHCFTVSRARKWRWSVFEQGHCTGCEATTAPPIPFSPSAFTHNQQDRGHSQEAPRPQLTGFPTTLLWLQAADCTNSIHAMNHWDENPELASPFLLPSSQHEMCSLYWMFAAWP